MLKTKLESLFSGIAFAEAGEHDTALELAGIPASHRSFRAFLEDLACAVAFAEAAEREKSLEFLEGRKREASEMITGISGVRVWMGTIQLEQSPVLEIPGVKVWVGTVQA